MKVDRNKILAKTDGHCAYCGIDLSKSRWQVDHIIPKQNFKWHVKNNHNIPKFLSNLTEHDVNHIDNLFAACQSCNNYKSTLHLELFRHELGQLVIRLQKTSSIYRISKRFGHIKETNEPIRFYFEEYNSRLSGGKEKE